LKTAEPRKRLRGFESLPRRQNNPKPARPGGFRRLGADDTAATAAERLILAAGFDPGKAGGIADAGRIEGPGGDLQEFALGEPSISRKLAPRWPAWSNLREAQSPASRSSLAKKARRRSSTPRRLPGLVT